MLLIRFLQFAIVKTDAVRLKKVLFISTVVLFVLAAASGLLYRENKTYRVENQRLIIVNDSILSENIELKNALKQKSFTVLKGSSETLKTKEIK